MDTHLYTSLYTICNHTFYYTQKTLLYCKVLQYAVVVSQQALIIYIVNHKLLKTYRRFSVGRTYIMVFYFEKLYGYHIKYHIYFSYVYTEILICTINAINFRKYLKWILIYIHYYIFFSFYYIYFCDNYIWKFIVYMSYIYQNSYLSYIYASIYT